MESTQDIKESSLASIHDAWATLQAHAQNGTPLEPAAYRLAFADPEFLLRPETRGVRFQLELLKPDLDLSAAGVHSTVVVYGSARFVSPEQAPSRPISNWPTRAPVVTPPPSPPPNWPGATPSTTPRHGSSRAWWPPTASASAPRTGCSSAPAAAPASWRRPTAARTTSACLRWG